MHNKQRAWRFMLIKTITYLGIHIFCSICHNINIKQFPNCRFYLLHICNSNTNTRNVNISKPLECFHAFKGGLVVITTNTLAGKAACFLHEYAKDIYSKDYYFVILRSENRS